MEKGTAMSDELKTPLKVNGARGIIYDAEGGVISVGLVIADCAAIVHRVNCYDKLVDAVKSASVVLSGDGLSKGQLIRALEKCRDALELAKGGGQ